MKKFFQWIFPESWFVKEDVHTYTALKLEDFPDNTVKDFRLLILRDDDDDETPRFLHIELGITNERSDELTSMIQQAVNDSKTTVEAMNLVAPKITHLNEYFFVTTIMYNNLNRMSNPGKMIAEAIMRDMFGGRPDNNK